MSKTSSNEHGLNTVSDELTLRSVAEKGEALACCAVSMASHWPRLAVRRRELPAFTNFFLGQRNLSVALAGNRGPQYCYLEHGEPIYDKWALALWFAQKGWETHQEPLPYHDRIPRVWFMCDEYMYRCYEQINAFEIVLHRKAEEEDIIAQNLVMLAIHWQKDFVDLEEMAQFSDGMLTLAEFSEWSEADGVHIGAGTGAFYDKWELSFWLYENIDKLPPAIFGIGRKPIITPMMASAKQLAQLVMVENDPFDENFWREPEKKAAAGLGLEGLGWCNQEIRGLLLDIRRGLVKAAAEGTAAPEEHREDVASLMGADIEKIHVLMGHDMLEAFKRLKSHGPRTVSVAAWSALQWYDNLVRSIPKPLSTWNRLE